MSNEKKNPLIGAFRAPPVGTPPSPTQPAKQPETPKNVKAPATPLSAPILTKLEESKKTVEPAKDDKAVKDNKVAAAAPAHTKPEDGKKLAEPVKDDKAAKDGKPAATAPAPTKPEDGKKPTEPAKDDKTVKDSKPAAAAPVPTKPEEGKICSLPAFRHRHFQLFIWVCSRLEPRKRLDPAESIVGADTGHCRGIDRQHRPAQRVVTASTGKTSTETEECPWEKKSA